MSLEDFKRRLDDASARIGERGLFSGDASELGWVQAQLEEAWEELETADEELQAQSEQIAEAWRDAEGERLRYQELFEFAPEPLLVTDSLGKLRSCNRAAAQLFGLPAHGLTGRLLISFVVVPERSAFRERLSRVLRGSPREQWDCVVASPAEPSRRLLLSVAAAPDGRGGVLWSLRDVTAHRQQEEALRLLNASLEQRVMERTHELEASRQFTEELLVREREVRRRAEAASREKEEMIALVSHELRSPLHVVIGWARLALDRSDNSRGALEIIERNARAMSNLVDDLLDRARILRGDLALRRAPFDLRELLAILCSSFALGAEARGVSLVFKEAARTEIDGDRGRLEQVFTNLLANALKFTPAGGQIVVSLATEGACAVVHIQDNGIGIKPGLLSLIFDGYQQGEGGPSGRRRGLGLGLTIVHHVITAHGGKVRAASEGEGCGATFSVSLPLLEATKDGARG